MIKFIKRLCGLGKKPEPDVLVEDHNGGIKLYTSRVIGGRRVIYSPCDDIMVLRPDGTVRSSYWAKKWEPL